MLTTSIAVILSDGYSYERRAIVVWLASSNLSPTTSAPLPSRDLYPNTTLAKVAKVSSLLVHTSLLEV